jgi:hypothetical protein
MPGDGDGPRARLLIYPHLVLNMTMNNLTTLRTIKTIHTIAWAFFAGCILAIPFFVWTGEHSIAFILCGVVFLEVIILLLNKMRCPLTPIAARYTDERQPNFDIYLPRWLAQYNKEIFGTLYVAGILYTLASYYEWIP